MTIQELQTLLQTGQFHHATYRNQGTLWEGLHIYYRDPEGFRGFRHAGFFSSRSQPEELITAENLCRGTGISLGAYGQG
jgi:hypothetical protein